MSKIAAQAGVSAETVQLHGPKAALLRAAVEYTAFGGTREQNFLEIDEGRRLLAIDDRREAVEYLVATQTEVHQRTAPLGSALTAAATSDPELDRYLTELTAGITLQIRRVLETLRDRGWLRTDVPFDELVQTCAVLSSLEVYQRLTVRGGWTVDQYRAWSRRMLTESVFAQSRAKQGLASSFGIDAS